MDSPFLFKVVTLPQHFMYKWLGIMLASFTDQKAFSRCVIVFLLGNSEAEINICT